jgi:16S rRNA (adenine1518-N6/adenine1519-N6)-dimethyltransferase
MNLDNIQRIKTILRENNLWAKKSFGQNFLLSEDVLEKIVKSANINKNDTIVEIGPGLGILTEELARYAKLVLAIEKDQQLVDFLRKRFKSYDNVKIIHADILTYNLEFITDNYKVVANLPYNITSPIIRKFLEGDQLPVPSDLKNSKLVSGNWQPETMVLMVQKEVAERICAQPGNSERGILTVMVEFYAQAEIVDYVARENFWPQPNVDSAIIKIKVTNSYLRLLNKVTYSCQQPQVTPGNHKVTSGTTEGNNISSFFKVVKAGFSSKRRKIYNSLFGTLRLPKEEILIILKEAKINPDLRAEDLTLSNWLSLYEKIKKRI